MIFESKNNNKELFRENKEYIELIDTLDYYYQLFDKLPNSVNNFFVLFNTYDKYIKNEPIDIENINVQLSKFFRNIQDSKILNLLPMIYNLKTTLLSIKECITLFDFASSFTLLRKFKDDFLLFAYFIKLGNFDVIDSPKEHVKYMKNVKNAFDWADNIMSDVYSKNIIDYFLMVNCIKSFDENTKILNNLKILNQTLNKFAHSNGISYITKYDPIFEKERTLKLFSYFTKQLDIVVTSIFTIVFYLSPKYLQSIDYLDYIEAGLTPPEGCQYWVAPYLQDFIKDRINNVNPQFKIFLQEHTSMDIK